MRDGARRGVFAAAFLGAVVGLGGVVAGAYTYSYTVPIDAAQLSTTTVNVLPAVDQTDFPAAIDVTPPFARFTRVGEKARFKVVADYYGSRPSFDVTGSTALFIVSSDTNVVRVSADGVMTAVSAGTVAVRVSYRRVTYNAGASVTPGETIVGLTPVTNFNEIDEFQNVAPENSLTLAIGATGQIVVEAAFSDNDIRPMEGFPVVFVSENPTVASVAPDGSVYATGAGSTFIDISYAGLSTRCFVTADGADTVPPITTLVAPGLHYDASGRAVIVSTTPISFVAVDPVVPGQLHSGVVATSYAVDMPAGAVNNATASLYEGPFNLRAGSHMLVYYSADKARNNEVKKSMAIYVLSPSTTSTR